MAELAGLAVEGISVGGIETCIEVPSYKLAFDVGRCAPSVVRYPTILFTHAHVDHMGGVVAHAATRALRGMAPPRYVVPRENHEAFETMFAAWRALDHSTLAFESVPLALASRSPTLLIRLLTERLPTFTAKIPWLVRSLVTVSVEMSAKIVPWLITGNASPIRTFEPPPRTVMSGPIVKVPPSVARRNVRSPPLKPPLRVITTSPLPSNVWVPEKFNAVTFPDPPSSDATLLSVKPLRIVTSPFV